MSDKDYMKEPATPEQAPQVGAKKSSAVPAVVIVLIVVFVGLPILLAIAGIIFVSVNFDKITDWVDAHVEEDYPRYSSYYVVDEPRQESALTIYAMTRNSRVRKGSGISKVDCQNMQMLAEKAGYDFIGDTFCDASEIEIGSETKTGSVVHLYMSNDKECADFEFYSNFSRVTSYKKQSARHCDETKTVKIIDTGEIPEPMLDLEGKEKKDGKSLKVIINES